MNVRRWGVLGLGGLAAAMVATATAWACVSGPAISLATLNAKAGQDVAFTATGFKANQPVIAKFNALDGPVVGTFTADKDGLANGTVKVPDGTKAGSYVMVFTQEVNGNLTQVPTRALIQVTGDGGTSPVVGAPLGQPTAARATGLVHTDNSVSGGTLALVALGVGGIGMFVAGIAALFAGRARRAPEAARARS